MWPMLRSPKPWQMDLQEPAGIIATKATDLHNFLLVVITLISVFVLGLLVYVCIKFREKPNIKPSKTSHNTLIEIIVDGCSSDNTCCNSCSFL